MEKNKDEFSEVEAQFEIKDLLGIGLTLLVLVIGLAYGLEVLGDVRDDMAQNTSEYNATVDGISAIAKIPNKLPLIVTVIVAAVIIGVLVRYLWVQYK